MHWSTIRLRSRLIVVGIAVLAAPLLLAPTPSIAATRTLLAGDEFTGPVGSPPNRGAWTALTGGSGWGNEELQTYTDRTANASLDGNGNLRIVARKEAYTGSDGISRGYTSARLYARQSFQYGYLEARILLPAGQGLWPAMWTVGADALQGVPWPQTGEIDIMEAINDMAVVSGTIHGPTAAGGAYAITSAIAPTSGTLAGSWHTYAIDWTASSITWYLDGRAYSTISRATMPAGDTWEFDKPHLLQLNLAVGGNIPGSPDASTPFPSTMLVDYVRYYSN